MLKPKDIAVKQKALDAELLDLLEKDELSDSEEARLGEIEAEQKDLEIKKVKAEKAVTLKKEAMARAEWANSLAEEPESIVNEVSGATVRERVLDDPKLGFDTYEMFARDVKDACQSGGRVSDKLKSAYGNNTESGSEGGFLIPPEYSNRLIERANSAAPILEQCDRLTLSGNTVKINGMIDNDKSSSTYRYGGVIPYWVGEGNQITRSSLKFRQLTLSLNKLAALSYVTEEEMEDVSNFGTRLLDKQGMAMAGEMVEAVMFGTGVSKPLGAFTGTSPCVQVAKETDQAADTIVAENIIKMNSVIADGSYGKGNWYYNGECLPQLELMSIAVGTGGIPVYMPAGGLASKEHGSLKGRPAYVTDHCEALGDAGDIVFADWSQYILATKGTTKTAMSIHLRFDYDEVAFKSTFRVDGRPAWDTNLKPRKGDSDRRVSPFVKLAARA